MRTRFSITILGLSLLVASFSALPTQRAYASTPIKIYTTAAEGYYPTNYDWSAVTEFILRGTTTKIEQAEAIYTWICQNIAYDTTHTIYHADECYDNRRGLCQAYCELFWHIAHAASLECVIISGKTKDESGTLDTKEHDWILCNIGEEWIMIDPTWGAGWVDGNGQFVRNQGDKSWFNVPPKWMFLTHLPDNPEHQYLEEILSTEHFFSLYAFKPFVAEYGNWGVAMLDEAFAKPGAKFPKVYTKERGNILIDKAPMTKVLKVGEHYTFRVKKLVDSKITLLANNKEWVLEDQWALDPEGYYNISYMPCSGGELSLSVKTSGFQYFPAVTYTIATPTEQELAHLESAHPLATAQVRGLKNYKQENIDYTIEKLGLSPEQLLTMAKSGEISALPVFTKLSNLCDIISIPINGELKVNTPYTFTIKPKRGWWRIINMEHQYEYWEEAGPNGEVTITITPKKVGKLYLSVCADMSNNFSTAVRYSVVE